MPALSSSQKTSAKGKSSRVNTLKMDPTEPPTKRMRPLSQLSKPPKFDLGLSQPSQKPLSQSQAAKGKGKERAASLSVEPEELELQDDRLWVDIYEPTTEAELAVHVRKVRDVRQWLTEAFDTNKSDKLRKYRRILALSGPAGTAKTATIRVLARELNIEILEWRNAAEENFARYNDFDEYEDDRIEYVGLSQKFQAFLTRAANCRSIFGHQPVPSLSQSSQSSSTAMGPPKVPPAAQRQLVLLEDLPNLLHIPTQQAFHAAIEGFVKSPSTSLSPVVIIVSDAGVRGETGDDASSTVNAWRGKEAMDLRTVIPPSLLNGPFVANIAFNPIAPTLMKRALQDMLNKHFAKLKATSPGRQPSKEMLDLIADSSNGDIRSAIMALQFACSASWKGEVGAVKGQGKARRARPARGDPRPLIEAVTRKEQSLALFHLVGKVLYNKRKGDPPAKSTSAKDAQKERDMDSKLKDPLKLPPHLSEHERKASRVDIDTLYADSPIDSSLLSLYIHQNYTQYCNELDECDGIIDWLSWVDSSGGDSWLQANPHRFHLITLGTLHSLPTPVERRNQKPYKPEFFDVVKRSRDSEDAIGDVQRWLRSREDSCATWMRHNIALEIGGVLKAIDSSNSASTPSASQPTSRPPPSHRAFSKLEFVYGAVPDREVVNEADVPHEEFLGAEGEDGTGGDGYGGNGADGGGEKKESAAERGGWLEEDDIEEF